ncbi:MAG: hypothetical protein ACLUE1_03360 [Adlercreutzia equolifaciens]
MKEGELKERRRDGGEVCDAGKDGGGCLGRQGDKRLSVDDLVAFMGLPIFYELRTAVDMGILLFDDLDEYDLPEGYSKEDIWRILLAVRKQAAVFVPRIGAHGDMWMVTTSSLSFSTEMLEVRSGRTPRWRDRSDMQGSPFVTRFIERTLVRGLDEGIAVDERVLSCSQGAT